MFITEKHITDLPIYTGSLLNLISLYDIVHSDARVWSITLANVTATFFPEDRLSISELRAQSRRDKRKVDQ